MLLLLLSQKWSSSYAGNSICLYQIYPRPLGCPTLGSVLAAWIFRGTKLLCQKFCTELEFSAQNQNQTITICRILGFVPVSIIYFRHFFPRVFHRRRSIVFRVLFQQTNKQTNQQALWFVPLSVCDHSQGVYFPLNTGGGV